MKIRMLTTMAGPEINVQANQIVDLDNEFAKRLIAIGSALPLDANKADIKHAESKRAHSQLKAEKVTSRKLKDEKVGG